MIHIICGDGKGKTTAAVGLTVRASGAGMRTAFFQFLKDGSSSEIKVLGGIDGITVKCCTECRNFTFRMDDEEKALVTARHNNMIAEAEELMKCPDIGMIVLDEFLDAYNTGLIDRESAEKLVSDCPSHTELVLTGRDPAPVFCELADYHSEIRSVRHPYEKGIAARRGIEY